MSLFSLYKQSTTVAVRPLVSTRIESICARYNTHCRLSTSTHKVASSQPVSEDSDHKDPRHLPVSVRLKGVNKSQGVTKVVVDGELKEFNHTFLRDACSCPRCVDPSTKQKLFQTADIPGAIKPKSTHRTSEGDLRLVWNNDICGYGKNHVSVFTREFFHDHVSRDRRIRAQHNVRPQMSWNQEVMEKKVKWVSYDAYMSNDKDLHDALEHLSAYGLVFLQGVPDSEQAVEQLGTRIGSLRDTFYGRTWDVKSVPNAKNVAYTNQYLGLHMDLLYMAQPPGLQLLHCLRSSCTGGNSIFSDSFRAARSLTSHELRSLSSFPVTYQYQNAGEHYHFTRPTVEWQADSHGRQWPIANINWSPPFQAPFEMGWSGSREESTAFSRYLKAAKAFSTAVEAPESLFELRLEPGQCVIFNNRRVLHARRAFDIGSGERWLKGAYVDSDAFLSRLRVLRGTYGQDFGLSDDECELELEAKHKDRGGRHRNLYSVLN
ncbi:MAG: hypothetical protein M1812_004391 [Candelaria pacifica]|nr:MAG: hypothetical protein M1812_004391 [Candelaria pacifica]